jgi:hypothetical protein
MLYEIVTKPEGDTVGIFCFIKTYRRFGARTFPSLHIITALLDQDLKEKNVKVACMIHSLNESCTLYTTALM